MILSESTCESIHRVKIRINPNWGCMAPRGKLGMFLPTCCAREIFLVVKLGNESRKFSNRTRWVLGFKSLRRRVAFEFPFADVALPWRGIRKFVLWMEREFLEWLLTGFAVLTSTVEPRFDNVVWFLRYCRANESPCWEIEIGGLKVRTVNWMYCCW